MKAIDPDGIERTREITRQLNRWRKLKKPKTIKELTERVDGYFEKCSELNMLPSLETFALALAVHRTTVFRWRNGTGCSAEWCEVIQSAVSCLEAYIDTAGNIGSINPIWLIWKEKSVFGKSDQLGHSDAERSQMVLETSYTHPMKLLEKYADDSDEVIAEANEAVTEPTRALDAETRIPSLLFSLYDDEPDEPFEPFQ